MSWGVFQNSDDGWIHVAPCDEDGRVTRDHALDLFDCWCKPTLHEDGIVMHHDPHWPGADEIKTAIQ